MSNRHILDGVGELITAGQKDWAKVKTSRRNDFLVETAAWKVRNRLLPFSIISTQTDLSGFLTDGTPNQAAAPFDSE